MKVTGCAFISCIFFVVFFIDFSKSKNILNNVYVDGVNISLIEVHATKNSKPYYEYIVKYGEIKHKEWFKPAIAVTESGNKSRCAQWDEGYNKSHSDESKHITYESFKDCLILKIETNNLNTNSPVMVYIPGFDLSSGDVDSTSGHYLLDKNIVLVTVQYRIGVLGFLSTNTEKIPGNAGILDIILALKWIKRNIEKFGGNPNRITLFGQYKAAGLIGVLTISPLAENLFHQVIYQSGTMIMSNLTTLDPYKLVTYLANEVDCSELETHRRNIDLNECLLNANYGELLHAYRVVTEQNDDDIPLITVGGLSGVLPYDVSPLELLASKKFRAYPTMGGVVHQPAVLLLDHYNLKNYSTFSLEDLDSNYKDKLEDLNLNDKLKNNDTETDELFKEMIDITNTLVKGLIQIYLPIQLDLIGLELKTDLLGVLDENKKMGVPVYLYEFKYEGTKQYFPKKRGTWLKNYVTLLDDNIYLFKPDKVISKKDQEIAEIMTDLWSSFAQNGHPASNKLDEIGGWPQTVDTDGPYLIIDQTLSIGTNYTVELTPFIDCENTAGCEWLEDKFKIDN